MINNYIIAANERQAQLEAAKAAFFASGKQVEVGTAPPEHPTLSVRRDWIDPKTVLKRKPSVLSRRDRKALKAMAAAL